MEEFANKYVLSEIWIYPVKSLSGIQLSQSIVEKTGLKYDRRWMIVDENNRFLSQRELPEMALIAVDLIENNNELESIVFSHKNNKTNNFEYIISKADDQKLVDVQIWDDNVKAIEIEDEVNGWLSFVLKANCRLVYLPTTTKRTVDPKYAIEESDITSFSDAYPFLIIGDESLKLLNSKLELPISMNRFRPNFVFEGGRAHDEDSWGKFSIRDATFIGVKNCARCPITTINQETSITGKEPLKTLSTYQFRKNKVYFGQNLLVNNLAEVKLGDIIEVDSINSYHFEK